MLRIDRTQKRFVRLEPRFLSDAGIKERQDLQQMICGSWDAFCQEIGEELKFIGQEVRPTDLVEDRIDVLAVDRQGQAVIIELKRDDDKLQLLQAIAYAGMVAKWSQDRFVETLSRQTQQSQEDADDDLTGFLDSTDGLNETQRIILIAGAFDYEVLAASEWLSERYEVDVRCYRLTLATDGSAELLTFACIYPPQGISDHAVRRSRRGTGSGETWANWEEALAGVQNSAVAEFFRREVASGGVEPYLPSRAVSYRVGGKRRWNVEVRRKVAYVWQLARFSNDAAFWRERLSQPDMVKPVNDGQCLRFFLSTEQDFQAFITAVKGELATAQFERRLSEEEAELENA